MDPAVQRKPIARQLRPEQVDRDLVWSFRFFDKEQRWTATSADAFCEVAHELRAIEEFNWSGLVNNQDYFHDVEIDRIIPDAQKQLTKIKMDDRDSLTRLRCCSNMKRMWGIKDGNVFYILWWDPEHRICPSKKKHT